MGKQPSKKQLQAESQRATKRSLRQHGVIGTINRISSNEQSSKIVLSTHHRNVLPHLLEPPDVGPPETNDAIDVPVPLEEDQYVAKEDLETEHTQTRAAIQSFMDRIDLFQDLLMEQYEYSARDATCDCRNGQRTVQCHDCFRFNATCRSCFVDQHKHLPFHWALVWDSDNGHYIKCPISDLTTDQPTLTLGHDNLTPCPGSRSNVLLTVVHTNGIHRSRIRYCDCPGASEHFKQLMRVRLFPGTVSNPRTAFTFEVLKEYSMHNLQSKCGAFDYMKSLRRLTDNVFPNLVANPYKLLLRVSRIWEYLTLRKRTGQAHGFDRFYPTRPTGSVVVYCPCCPEAGVNTDVKDESIPDELRHLRRLYITLDGNHRCNRYRKNTDQNDRSLWNGAAYFPSTEEYDSYLNPIPKEKEKSVCNFIAAVNAQDRKKFIGNDETGLINVQCSHVLVHSSVDMYYGERFAYSDYALARAFRGRSLDGLDVAIAYDSACSYSINAAKRFEMYLSPFADTIKKSTFTIDALHVNDHIDRCMYLYSANYLDWMGHFHGVGTEQYWAENNQLGPQTRQMNKGHRQDKINLHHGDWNFKKIVTLALTLSNDLRLAWRLFITKKEFLERLSQIHKEFVPIWYEMDRSAKRLPNGKVISVYKHNTVKVPTLASVCKSLKRTKDLGQQTQANAVDTPSFLLEGIMIEAKQQTLRLMVENNVHHPLASTKQDIVLLRREVTDRLQAWRTIQKALMPSVGPFVLSLQPCDVENRSLFLPSHFTHQQRLELALNSLASEEAKLREGQARDCILQLRQLEKSLSAIQQLQKKETRGQKQSTRSQSKIQSVKFIRDSILVTYETCRTALRSAKFEDSVAEVEFANMYPSLTEKDLFRKNTNVKRQRGDAHRPEGDLWVWSGSLGTENVNLGEPEREREHGKLWNPIMGLSDADIQEWEKEEDRVQWHRAYADMSRWLEQFELKHIEFSRCIRSFNYSSSVWLAASKEVARPGYSPFAKRQSHLYASLRDDATAKFTKYGFPGLGGLSGAALVKAIGEFREKELAWLKDLVGQLN